MSELIKQLSDAVRHHNYLYWVAGRPEVSDEEYDQLVERLRQLDPSNVALTDLGVHVAQLGSPVVHMQPMLSLDKAYDLPRFLTWYSSCGSPSVVCSLKLDGVACSLLYDRHSGILLRAATRGDGDRGEDITASAYHRVPRQIHIPSWLNAGRHVEVRGEFVISDAVFRSRFSDTAANSRNLAAGLLKRKDGENSDALEFFAYDLLGVDVKYHSEKSQILSDFGFRPLPLTLLVVDPESPDSVHGYIQWFIANRENFGYRCDGLVFRIEDEQIFRQLGSTSHHPRGAIAYKVSAETRRTHVLSLEWGLSRQGTITPVAHIEPVELSGATVSQINLFNLRILRELGLYPGIAVDATRRGEVIPYIERSYPEQGPNVPPVFGYPRVCPSCGSPTVVEGDFLRCRYPDCGTANLARLEHWCKTVEMDGWGEGILSNLFSRGRTTIPSLYYISQTELAALPRSGYTLAARLVVSRAATMVVPLATFLAGIGIPSVGRVLAKTIAQQYPHMATNVQYPARVRFHVPLEELQQVPGVGPETARAWTAFWAQHHQWVDELLSVPGFQVVAGRQEAPVVSGPLSGKRVVLTGRSDLWGTKEQYQNQIEMLGGTVSGTVDTETDFLVVGGRSSKESTKLKKAHKMGITVMPDVLFDEYLKRVQGAT